MLEVEELRLREIVTMKLKLTSLIILKGEIREDEAVVELLGRVVPGGRLVVLQQGTRYLKHKIQLVTLLLWYV